MRSPNYQFDTDRQHDISLGRCLKNWSNRHEPPKESRQKLLDAAIALQPTLQRRELWNLFKSFISWLLHGSNEYDWNFGAQDAIFSPSGTRRNEKSYSMMIFLYATRASVSAV